VPERAVGIDELGRFSRARNTTPAGISAPLHSVSNLGSTHQR